jgi:tRNA threonylcarbamoyl adenosine modification protein (Sua5/YciO/YrdC/YwlC family)
MRHHCRVTLVLTVDRDRPDPDAVARIVETIRSGGIVAIPTDTLYGLAVDPRDSCAVARLFELKGRGAAAAVPLVAADVIQVRDRAGRMTAAGERLAARFWPGPLALVVDAHRDLVAGVRAVDASVAVRVPAHAVPRAIARALGAPLTATSANRSGATPAADAAAVRQAFGSDLDAIVDAGPAPGGAPSTIVDARRDEPRLVREGAIAWAAVLESLQ